MLFEWDDSKAVRNVEKHGVAFSEAATVFGDPFSITWHDPDHSADEDRFLTFGYSQSGKLLVVSHTDRGDYVRLISARIATRKERKLYEEG
ncbi:BrnT family toxin [bacterium]|nr:BrnT family toxin [bacterium]